VKPSKWRVDCHQKEELLAENDAKTDALGLATDLTVAWLSNPNTRASAEDVPVFLGRLHAELGYLATPQATDQPAAEQHFTPAVSVRKSLASPDHIISMIDGTPYKTLRRHLARHGLTPAQYRERFGLKPDYPIVSEAYSQVRREMAKRIGLGRKAAAPSEPPKRAAHPRRRQPAAGAGRLKPKRPERNTQAAEAST
jgi:predicted transcriptional regulator